MTEQPKKACPLFAMVICLAARLPGFKSSAEEQGVCIEGKCQMWRKRPAADEPGYCGLAGKPPG